jgi:hypothetical protein
VAKVKKELTTTTADAAKKSATVGATRAGRDQLTRATYTGKVIKGKDTHARQWNRYSP